MQELLLLLLLCQVQDLILQLGDGVCSDRFLTSCEVERLLCILKLNQLAKLAHGIRVEALEHLKVFGELVEHWIVALLLLA